MRIRQIPNIISLVRCIIAMALIVCICLRHPINSNVFLVFFSIAFVSDAIDGWLARYFNVTSAIGAWLDLIADKTLFLSIWLYILNDPITTTIQYSILLLVLRDVIITVVRHCIKPSNNALNVKNHGKYKTLYLGVLSIITVLSDSYAHLNIFYYLPTLWVLGVIISWYSFVCYIIELISFTTKKSTIHNIAKKVQS